MASTRRLNAPPEILLTEGSPEFRHASNLRPPLRLFADAADDLTWNCAQCRERQVSKDPFSTNIDQLALDEPLSPESVLVLPPALRAQAIGRLGPQTWPKRPQCVPEVVPEVRSGETPVLADESFMRTLSVLAAGRVVQLGLIFAAVTILTLAMSVVAQAVR